MGQKILNTRIQNRFDTLANWKVEGVNLLPGEIALVSVTTQQIDAATGNVVNVPAVLMKVGEEGKTFNQLPWLSAKAADVYDWAKGSHAENVVVKELISVDDAGNETWATDGKKLKEWVHQIESNTGRIAAIEAKFSGENSIDTRLDAIDGENGLIATTAAQTLSDAQTFASNQDIVVLSEAQAYTDAKAAANAGAIEQALADIAGVRGSIGDAIKALDGIVAKDAGGNPTVGSFVKDVTQTDGIVEVTYGNITEAELPNISAEKVIVTPASGTEGEENYKEAVTVADKFEEISAEVGSLKTSVAGGVHFVGTVDAIPTSATITVNGTTNHTATAGDVVIYAKEGTEYIYTGTAWEELGDTTRIGALETKLDNLDVTDTAVANQFVTAVSQEDGKISVSRAQAVAADILYEAGQADTVYKKIGDNAQQIAKNTAKLADIDENSTVGAAITAAIEALDAEDVNSSGATTDYEFIASVTQTNGKITALKKSIPDATDKVKGVVLLGAENGAATYESVNTLSADVSAVESNYMRIGEDDNLYAGKSGVDVIIFNCGNASSWITEA